MDDFCSGGRCRQGSFQVNMGKRGQHQPVEEPQLLRRDLSQPVVTQPPSASTSLEQTAKLSCTLSSGYSGYKVDWYQQNPRKGPRFVMRVGTSDIVGDKGAGIPDCFSGSGSGLDWYLTIQNIQEEDEYRPLWSRPWQWKQLHVTTVTHAEGK